MTKKALLKINSKHIAGGETEPMEVLVEADYYCRGGKHYFLYEDADDESGATIKNIIKTDELSVEVTKNGDVKSTMKFENGKAFNDIYQTPFGTIMLEVKTTGLDIQIGEEEIKTMIEYSLFLDGGHVSDCQMDIQAQFR